MRLLLLTVAAALLAVSSGAVAQDFPRLTAERDKLVNELLDVCLRDKGLLMGQQPGRRGKILRVADRDKLRATLATRRQRLGPELRDALLALWTRANEDSRPALVVLLEAVGRETRDEYTLGMADFLAALPAQRQGQLPQAKRGYRQAIAHFRNAKQTAWQATSLNNLGMALQTDGSYDAALDCLRQALDMRRQFYAPDRYPDGHPQLANSLNNLALVLNLQGRQGEGLGYYRQAVRMYEKLYPDGHAALAQTLTNLSGVLADQGALSEAQRVSERALEMCRKLYPPTRFPNGHAALAQALHSLGSVLGNQGAYDEGLRYSRQALAMRRKLYPAARYPNGHPLLAASLGNVGVGLREQGSYAEALDCCKQALEMNRKLYPAALYASGHPDLALSLNNVAMVLHVQGAYGEALGYLRQTLQMQRNLYPRRRYPDGHPALAVGLSNLGQLCLDMGLPRPALASFRQALAMKRKLYPRSRYPDGHPLLATSLNNLGAALERHGAYAEALAYHREALAINRKLYPTERYPNSHPDVALSLTNLGLVLDRQGLADDALAHYRQALEIRRNLYPPGRYPAGHVDLAQSQTNLGGLRSSQGVHAEALKCFGEALQNFRVTRKPLDPEEGPALAAFLRPDPSAAKLLQSRASVLTRMLDRRSSGEQLRRAERALALAATLHDRLRSEILSNEADKLRHGHDAALQVALHVDVLARLFQREGKGQDLRTAFSAIEQGRARVFLESLGAAHAAALAGLPANLAAEERRLSLALRQLDARIQRLSLQAGDEPARQVRQLYADRLQLEEQEKVFLDKLRQSYPQYAGFRHPQPCSVEEARSCLRANEVALLFAVGTDFSYALLLEKTPRPGDPGQGIRLVRLPGGKDLNPLLGTLLTPDTLQHPARARDLAADLYHKLLGPLHERLKGKDLLLVPDGALALLPFEMLVEGQTDDEDGHWLIEQHRIRYAPSLSALHLSRQVKRQKPTQLLWAVADPLFGDKFRRLTHSDREVESICKVLAVPVEQTLRGVRASEAAVKAARDELAQARFVHFATHGIVSERSAYATALVLNQMGNDGKEELGGINDGFLRLPEITFLKLNADVVVLSACETARGRRSGGEGVSGLARTFLYAGSRGVVCSLWSVDDSRTADLMADFYKHLKEGKSTTDALRQAQLVTARKGLAPFFWAPFVHMGE